MKMTGSWHIYRTGERWRRSTASARAVIETEDGWTAVCFSAPHVKLRRTGRRAGPPRPRSLCSHTGPGRGGPQVRPSRGRRSGDGRHAGPADLLRGRQRLQERGAVRLRAASIDPPAVGTARAAGPAGGHRPSPAASESRSGAEGHRCRHRSRWCRGAGGVRSQRTAVLEAAAPPSPTRSLANMTEATYWCPSCQPAPVGRSPAAPS